MGVLQEYDPTKGENPPGPDTGTTTGPGKPIGVPEDYPIHFPKRPSLAQLRESTNQPLKPGQKPTSTLGQAPFYMDGDDWIPANYSPDMIFSIQQGLVTAGLLTSSYSTHVWDQPTRMAYRELLAISNASGMRAEEKLAELLATAAAGGIQRPGTPPPPLVTRTTDPESLRQVFRKAVIDLTGQGWNRAQIDSAISAYNQIEVQRQQEAYNATYYNGGGNVQDIPDPTSYIESKVQAENPDAVAGESALNFIDLFVNTATGSGWGS